MNQIYLDVLASFTGLLAGFIDSIAGGGGLITLPVLTLLVGAGAQAIGTNKIVGTVGALLALLVYMRKGHLPKGKSFLFAFFVVVGSCLGSRITPWIPIAWFKILLLLTCPLVLYVVWNRQLWISTVHTYDPKVDGAFKFSPMEVGLRIPAAGLLCGLYDGMWGPGGGTFMFLGLLFIVKLPLIQAIAASKLANTGSAGIALWTFSQGGYVHWRIGFVMAAGMALGAVLGANFALKNAERIVRPVLVLVVALLLVKVFLFG